MDTWPENVVEKVVHGGSGTVKDYKILALCVIFFRSLRFVCTLLTPSKVPIRAARVDGKVALVFSFEHLSALVRREGTDESGNGAWKAPWSGPREAINASIGPFREPAAGTDLGGSQRTHEETPGTHEGIPGKHPRSGYSIQSSIETTRRKTPSSLRGSIGGVRGQSSGSGVTSSSVASSSTCAAAAFASVQSLNCFFRERTCFASIA